MRILHCLRAPVGGLFRHVLDLAGEQAQRGHEVGILADSNAEDRLTGEKFASVAPLMALGITRVPMSRQPGLGDLQALRAVVQHARPLGLDVLHGHGAKGGAYARLAARSLRRRGQTVKSFYTPHGGSLNFKPGTVEARVFLALERLLEGYGSGLIFESAYAARVYSERIHKPEVPVEIIPNGLRPEDFVPAVPRPDATDLLFVGELRDLKGVDYLIDAIVELNKARRVTATLVGSGPSGEALKAKVQALGFEDRIRFTGALPAREAFTLGRVMVVPSLAESFPYIVLEAAAAGLPLVSTNVGGIPEIVSGTDTTLIAPQSVTEIVTAAGNVLNDLQTATAKAQRLRENVSAKFTVGGMTDGVLRFYSAVAR